MLLLPLYYQILRGEGAFDAGLLLAPQGLGAIVAMIIGGRLTDRIGAGYVVPVGVVIALIGTFPFTQLSVDSSYVWLSIALFVRGMGLGAVMMPTISSAYAAGRRLRRRLLGGLRSDRADHHPGAVLSAARIADRAAGRVRCSRGGGRPGALTAGHRQRVTAAASRRTGSTSVPAAAGRSGSSVCCRPLLCGGARTGATAVCPASPRTGESPSRVAGRRRDTGSPRSPRQVPGDR